MARGVEFTDVADFERETRRMPNFTLHELAHGYHDRVLPDGFGNAEIKAAYERAKAGGRYERVEQRFGDGRSATVRAYAMTNPQEYFAECTEAFFSTNDFFPFTRKELAEHDPAMFEPAQEALGRARGNEMSPLGQDTIIDSEISNGPLIRLKVRVSGASAGRPWPIG